ncbi:MAG: alpha/beta hydrolase [Rhodococcus sp. (in: high G+C Gram-positive bacteria)]
MDRRVQLGPVDTWYGEDGEGEPLVFLHPGGVDSRALEPNLVALTRQFRVFTPERRGHGRTPDAPGPMTFDDMATDTIAFVETVVGGPARFVGCSDGAVVALLVALRRPDLVERLACVAGVFHRDGWGGGVSDPDQATPQFLVDMYGEISPDGADHYPVVARKLDDMHRTGPAVTPEQLSEMDVRLLVMIGDDDEVTIEHASEFYARSKRAELAIVPGTSHGLLVEKPELCNALLLDFLVHDAVQTFAPIRRA